MLFGLRFLFNSSFNFCSLEMHALTINQSLFVNAKFSSNSWLKALQSLYSIMHNPPEHSLRCPLRCNACFCCRVIPYFRSKQTAQTVHESSARRVERNFKSLLKSSYRGGAAGGGSYIRLAETSKQNMAIKIQCHRQYEIKNNPSAKLGKLDNQFANINCRFAFDLPFN